MSKPTCLDMRVDRLELDGVDAVSMSGGGAGGVPKKTYNIMKALAYVCGGSGDG